MRIRIIWKTMILWTLIFQPLFIAYGQATQSVAGDKSVSQQAGDIELLKAEVKRLTAENAKLKEENQQLRKILAKQDLFEPSSPPSVQQPRDRSSPSTQSIPQSQDKPSFSVQSSTSPTTQQETGYWMTNSSGKRHNKNCRYYKNSNGHFCKPDEGIACKICGG